MSRSDSFRTLAAIRNLRIEIAKVKNEIACAMRDLRTVSGRVQILDNTLASWERQEKTNESQRSNTGPQTDQGRPG